MFNRFDGRATALIADDDPIGLMILESFLESLSIKTHSATTVAGAKELLTKFIPDIAILDVQFPDGDGIDILLAMRQANLDTAIAFVTASLENFPFYKCEATQPDMLFGKPLDESAVRAWVERVAGLRGLAWGEFSKAG